MLVGNSEKKKVQPAWQNAAYLDGFVNSWSWGNLAARGGSGRGNRREAGGKGRAAAGRHSRGARDPRPRARRTPRVHPATEGRKGARREEAPRPAGGPLPFLPVTPGGLRTPPGRQGPVAEIGLPRVAARVRRAGRPHWTVQAHAIAPVDAAEEIQRQFVPGRAVEEPVGYRI